MADSRRSAPTQADPLLDKVPPHSLDAEMAVLGAMMHNPETIGVCIEHLDADCFYRQEHRTIFQCLVEHFEANRPLDFVLMKQALADAGKLEEVGGDEYLITLAESFATAASAEYYARIVKDKAVLRGLLQAAGEIIRDVYSPGEPLDDVLDRCEQRIFQVTERKLVGQAIDVRAILSQMMQTLDLQHGRAVTGLETGYTELDDMTRGLQAGEFIVLAARPSVGKSALALNMAEHIAVDLRRPVAFFSLEMGRQELALRLLSSRARVDGQRLRKGRLNNQEAIEVREAAALLYEVPLLIDDTPGLRVIDLRAKARRLIARQQVAILIVDYLQLMTAPGAESRQVEVATISRGLKALARELNVPLLALSQLRRESEEYAQPALSDLRESGAIEQDADVVMLLHREEMRRRQVSRRPAAEPADAQEEALLRQEQARTEGTADLIIAKQRNGPTGRIRLTFVKHITRFEPYTPREAPAGPPAAPPADLEAVGPGADEYEGERGGAAPF
jgi:replicative DNA helicase